MKAIQFSALGGPDVLKLVSLPDPQPKAGEIVLCVKIAGMNHADVHFRRGLPSMKAPLPHIPGSDGAGLVESVGEGVTNVKVGDRVVMNPSVSCGTCERCLRGEISLCDRWYVLGRETDGTYAEFMTMPASSAIPIPSDVSFETAACVPIVYLTSWVMLTKRAQVKPGDTVLVMCADSGIGMAAIQIAQLLGANVIATVDSDEKREKTREHYGIDNIIQYEKEAIDKQVRVMTDKRGVDIAVDHVGGRYWTPLLRSVRNGGTLVTCGATAGHSPQGDVRQIFYRQVQVRGSTMGNHADLHHVLHLVFSGQLRPVIDHIYRLAEAAKAHRKMEGRKLFGKLLLTP